MDQAPWENEDLPLLDGLGDEDAGCGYEAHIKLPCQDKHHLGGPRVGVGRVNAAWGIVDPGHRDPERVQAWDLQDTRNRDSRAHGVVGKPRPGQRLGEEVIRFEGCLAREAIDSDTCSSANCKFSLFLHYTDNKKEWIGFAV